MQRSLALVNNLFKSKGSVTNCMTDRAPVHTGNASEQFLHRNRTLIRTEYLVLIAHGQNLPVQILIRGKRVSSASSDSS